MYKTKYSNQLNKCPHLQQMQLKPTTNALTYALTTSTLPTDRTITDLPVTIYD